MMRSTEIFDRPPLAEPAQPASGRQEASTGATLGLGDVRDVLLTRWRVLLFTVLVATVLATTVGLVLPPRYAATATVVVAPLSNDPSVSVSTRDAINMATEKEIMQSKEVAGLALENLGRSPEGRSDLLARMGTVAPDASQVLRVTVTADSADEAATLANAVAEAYLDFRRRGGVELAGRFMDLIDERVEQLTSSPDDAATREQVRLLTDQRRALGVFGQNPGRVIGRADPPREASGPGLPMFVLAGAVGGVILGAVLALGRERTDSRVRSLRRLRADVGSTPVVVDDLTDIEAFRWLRRQVTHLTPTGGPVLVASTAKRSDTVDIVGPFAEVARDSGYVVRAHDLSGLSPVGIDAWVRSGFASSTPPQDGCDVAEIHLIDATRVRSMASLSEIVDRSEALVLVTVPRDLRADVARIASLAADARIPLLSVLVRKEGRR